MSTLYESENTGDTTYANVYGTSWVAETFTPSISHTITSVKLLLYRVGSPGTLNVSIRPTSASLPVVGDANNLCSGSINGNALGTGTAGAWVECTFATGAVLTAGTTYAIVCRAPAGDTSNKICWREK